MGAAAVVLDACAALAANDNCASRAGLLLRRYVHGPGVDEPLVAYQCANPPGTCLTDRRYLITNHQGSVIAENGATTSLYRYGPYGEPDVWSGSRFRYTGQIALPEVQLYHYKARVYDPMLGRFLQTDPVGYEDGLNWYAFVGNDPLNRTDPAGLQANTCSRVGATSCSGDYSTNAGSGGTQANAGVVRAVVTLARWIWQVMRPSPRRPGDNRPEPIPLPPPPGMFSSPDPLVGDLANAIESAHPGSVAGVNVNLTNPNTPNARATEADILLRNGTVIQVKSQGYGGLSGQMQRTASATGQRVVGYAPNAPRAAIASGRNTGLEIYTSEAELLAAVAP